MVKAAAPARAREGEPDGEPIPLSPRALDLLFLFADRPGALFSKEDIFGELWRDIAVTDNALTQVSVGSAPGPRRSAGHARLHRNRTTAWLPLRGERGTAGSETGTRRGMIQT